MNVEAKYADIIFNLWKKELESLQDGVAKSIALRGYYVESELPHNDVLFVGMNPAFTKKDNTGSDFYPVETADNLFFNEIRKFSYDTLGYSNPSHHDLLFLRHTNQKELIDLFCKTEFWNRQLEISKEIISELSPKLIVVLNAGASKCFAGLFNPDTNYPIDEFTRELRYDETLGAYRFIINGKSTPVLFSGMLSGQRAIDNGSKRSLQWHISYICNILNIKA
ncbi:MAG: hypothetical protein ACI3Y4_00955 [Candidatus Cryptobacteroides sp.]